MRWTVWKGGLGEQPQPKVRALLLPDIFSLAGPQQHSNMNLTPPYTGNVCSTLLIHTHTRSLSVGMLSKTRQQRALTLGP